MKTILIFLGIGGLLFLQSCTLPLSESSQSSEKDSSENSGFLGGVGTGGVLTSTGGSHR